MRLIDEAAKARECYEVIESCTWLEPVYYIFGTLITKSTAQILHADGNPTVFERSLF